MSDAQTDAKNELLDSLLGDFLDESDQLLTQLNTNLLQLDEWVQSLGEGHQERCDDGLLNEMFRAAHSLKGLSAMLGLTDINQLTHKIENVFDAARHDQLNVTRDVTELMFMGLDQLTAMINLLKEPDGDPVDCDAVLELIRRVLQTAGAEKKQTTQADAERALESATGQSVSPADAGPGTMRQTDPMEGIEDDGDISDAYLSMFVDEADASLDALTSGLLATEGSVAEGELKALLGAAHKIKGSAASVGLNRAAKLAHLMEDLLENAVITGSSLTAQMTDVLLKCTDGLRQHVADLRRDGRVSDRFGPLASSLLAVRESPDSAHGTTSAPRESPDRTQGATEGLPDAGRPAVEAPAGHVTYVGEVTFQPDLPTAALKAQLIYEKLVKLGRVDDCQPPPERLDAIDRLDCLRFQVTTDQSVEAVASRVRIGGVLRVSVEPLAARPASPATTDAKPEAPAPSPAPEAQRPAPEAGQRAATPGQRPKETVRVDTDRLDQLMDLAGQLVISKAQFSQIGGRLKAVVDCNHAARAIDKFSEELEKLTSGTLRIDGQHHTAELESVRGQIRRIRDIMDPVLRDVRTLSRARDAVRELFEAIHQLDRVSDGIQKGIMDIRMVPIGPLFARFHRVVRDISRAGGKQIRLEIAGEKTELDKRMIDELGDPLVHLVRNSADHGIEPPDDREAAGKPRQGTVTLDAFHRGNSIVIEVRDDGKGLDADRILRKALEKGLVTEAEAGRMTPAQIYALIWKPGLSTAEKITDISGRGMGMDIVKAKIEELSGTVDIFSERGKGTTITIKLPLTLAILPSLMVDIGGDIFAVPMEAVTEIVSIERNHVRTVHGQPLATVRGRVVSLLRLGDLLNFHRGGYAADASQASQTTLVVVGDAGREIGLAVDRVIGEEDVVIKSIAENYENIRGVAGASVLGDGRVALILDVPALIAAISKRAAHATC